MFLATSAPRPPTPTSNTRAPRNLFNQRLNHIKNLLWFPAMKEVTQGMCIWQKWQGSTKWLLWSMEPTAQWVDFQFWQENNYCHLQQVLNSPASAEVWISELGQYYGYWYPGSLHFQNWPELSWTGYMASKRSILQGHCCQYLLQYRKISNIRHTKSLNLIVPLLFLQIICSIQ